MSGEDSTSPANLSLLSHRTTPASNKSCCEIHDQSSVSCPYLTLTANTLQKQESVALHSASVTGCQCLFIDGHQEVNAADMNIITDFSDLPTSKITRVGQEQSVIQRLLQALTHEYELRQRAVSMLVLAL